MKSVKILGAALGFAAIMAGCSNPVYVQRDESANLAKIRTYAWVDTHRAKDDNTPKAFAYADNDIRNAVNMELSNRGWREVNDNPDVLISHDILVERSSQQVSSPVYSQPFERYYYNPWFHRWGVVYYPSQFWGYDTQNVPVREGTVTITMMDPNTDKTIWQAWTTETLNNRRISNTEITNAVHDIFKKFDKEAK